MAAQSVYLLAGDEEFLKEEWLQGAKRSFFKTDTGPAAPGDNIDFNQFYAREADLSEVLSIARTKPFLAKKRLIVLKGIHAITSPSDRQQLLSYCKSPSPDAVVILETNKKDFLKDGFCSDLGGLAELVAFKKLYDRNLSSWVNKRFAIRKKSAAPQAVELLVQLKGNNLNALDEEIEKLTIYTMGRAAIEQGDVEELVGRGIAGSVYDIMDAIGRHNKEKALALSFDFNKKDLGNTVGLMCWSLRRVLRAREYIKKGWSAQKICDNFMLRGPQADKFMLQAEGLKGPWIKNALSELTELDLQIKTSGLPDLLGAWQMLLVRLLDGL